MYGDFAASTSHWCKELAQYYCICAQLCNDNTTIWLGVSPVELILGNYAVLFLGADIQPKTMVFWYLGFSLVFCWFSSFSPTQSTDFLKKTKVSCVRRFFPWFLKTKQFFFLDLFTSEMRTKWKYYSFFSSDYCCKKQRRRLNISVK